LNEGKAIMNSNQLKGLGQLFLLYVLLMAAFSVSARGVYQTNENFLAETFKDDVPKSKVIWIKGDLRKNVADILSHKYSGLRVSYWQRD